MLAATVSRFDPEDPVAGLDIGQVPEPTPRENWTTVDLRAAALNQHDLWSLRGVGLRAEQLPMILGTDGAGTAPDGTEVVLHAVIGGATGHGVGPAEPRSLLSERYPGTLAEQVSVPTWNLVPKPAELSWAEAACIPTAWLTAYRMLFPVGRALPGQRVLVQGAGGGVASAAISLAAAAGCEVWATSRSAAKRELALTMGATGAVAPGERLPARMDLVVETVGAATWSHSMKAVRPGGTVVVAGATTGEPSRTEMQRLFFLEISILGVTMGTKQDLENLLAFLARTGVRPVIDSTYALADAGSALRRLAAGEQIGKVVVQVRD
ncbi:zinc-binding dehydrogenase [Propionicicella superfundia]|uniref:zinc-binding dehydrogenase n=1 Tax=Propionicicella superfundia TaxID=348582 RepID=UPI00040F7597|nr:Zn-dependent alcohol dehydrogenase [Propionicicella superfundia]